MQAQIAATRAAISQLDEKIASHEQNATIAKANAAEAMMRRRKDIATILDEWLPAPEGPTPFETPAPVPSASASRAGSVSSVTGGKPTNTTAKKKVAALAAQMHSTPYGDRQMRRATSFTRK